MKWGPRWTLWVGAILMAFAPILDQLLEGPSAFARGLDPFRTDRLRAFGETAWMFCWLIPFAASFPRLRENFLTNWGATVGSLLLIIFAMVAAYRYDTDAVPGCVLMVLFLLSLIFLVTLGVAQVEFEVIAGWARILLFGALAALAAIEVVDLYAFRGWNPLISAVVLVLGALVCAAGEIWAIAAEPPPEPREEPEAPPA